MRQVLFFALIVISTGCGTVKPPPAPANEAPVARPTTPAPLSAARATKPSPSPGTSITTERWQIQTEPFLRGVAATDQHVVALAERELRVYAAADGSLVGRADVCSTFEGAIGRAGPDEVAVVCAREIQRFRVPSLALTARTVLRETVRAARFADNAVALLVDARTVRAFRLDPWTPTGVVHAAADVRTFAVAANAERVATGEGRAFSIIDLAQRQRIAGEQLEVDAVAFAAPPFVIASRPGATLRWDGRAAKTLSSLGESEWIAWCPRTGAVAVSGRGGVMVAGASLTDAQSVDRSLGFGGSVGLDFNPSGSHLVGADRDGRIALWGTALRRDRGRTIVVSRHLEKWGRRISGRVESFARGRAVIRPLGGGPTPLRGLTMKVLRFVSAPPRGPKKQPFAMRWMELGQGEVVADPQADKQGWVVVRLKHEPPLLPGGEPPFARGAAVELLWP